MHLHVVCGATRALINQTMCSVAAVGPCSTFEWETQALVHENSCGVELWKALGTARNVRTFVSRAFKHIANLTMQGREKDARASTI